MKFILKLYHVIIALLYNKILKNATQIVNLSASPAVIISLMPYHVFFQFCASTKHETSMIHDGGLLHHTLFLRDAWPYLICG